LFSANRRRDFGRAAGWPFKGWRRSKKIALIQSVNPQWSDLSRDLIDRVEASPDKSLCADP
jgi:hypothetical protein